MRKFLIALCFCTFAAMSEDTGKVSPPPAETKPMIQMAILLDTSGSMNGLIDQARAQLWAVVNTFIAATREGKKPELQVALYEYGKPTLGAQGGYIRQILPFTTDLDNVSKELFALRTDGGEEYCGWVIKTATEQLQWSTSAKDLKVIFIAGNEPFSQGPVDYHESCKAAIAKGIQVNTIHCGSEQQGIAEGWKDGAVLADGKYGFIDHNQAVVQIDAPQDKEIVKLNTELNGTYIAYGAQGEAKQQNQMAQDANASNVNAGSFSTRAACKASGNYYNGAWDLVDAYKSDPKKLTELKDAELPENLRKMTSEQRKEFVEAQMKTRAGIQEKILKLNEERTKYVAEEMKKKVGDKPDSLDKVMAAAAKEQAEKKSFEVK